MPRDIRDIVAECRRIEARGMALPIWSDWARFGPEEAEIERRRADHLIRLLRREGLEIVRVGESSAPVEPGSDVIWRWDIEGDEGAERLIRRAPKGRWEIVHLAKGGKETVEQSFSVAQAHLNADMVLTNDPAFKKIDGLGRQLAALAEIYRLVAQQPPATTKEKDDAEIQGEAG